MSRQFKQALAMAARMTANADSFVPVVLLSEENVEQCSEERFLSILANLNELCENRSIEERSKYIEMIYHRMLKILSRKISITEDRIVATVKEYVKYFPSMSILTLDELKTIGIQMEKRSIIIHFDMSGSMSTAGFSPLVQTISQLSMKFENEGRNVYFSLFGGHVQQDIHKNIGNRLLTCEEFRRGNYQPKGGTAFCPSFERTKDFNQSYDAIIISDGEFTDDISKLTFQQQCKTVFFIAPPWSPLGVEEKHAKSISSFVHGHVPYIGISSKDYSQLDQILDKYLREHHSFAHLNSFTTIGNSLIPNNLLAPTEMIHLFNHCLEQGEQTLDVLIKKYLGLFRYIEETAKLNFERCLRGVEFQSLMSLITPLIKLSFAYLETSRSSQLLYGYLNKILNDFANEKQKLVQRLVNDEKCRMEINKLWDSAMNFDERAFIIEENDKKYGPSVAFLRFAFENINCSNEIISQAFKQLKTINTPEDFDQLSLILNLLSSCKLSENSNEKFPIPIWRNKDGTIHILSLLRLFPICLQQYQSSKNLPLDTSWTLQPLAAIRLAWVMEASKREFPEFIQNALPSLIVPNKTLMDLDLDENRSVFWMKILRELTKKISLSDDRLQSIEQILTVHLIKSFLFRLNDYPISYEKVIYENVSSFIDTDQTKAWCIFVDRNGNRLNANNGQFIKSSPFITDPSTVHNYYLQNVRMHGAIVRPRYLTLIDYPQLTEGTIELYQTAVKKDEDILRDQLMELNNGMYSSDQINMHIYTIRDRIKQIPSVLWGAQDQIIQTIRQAKEACQGALIPTETVHINILRTVAIDYLICHCQQTFHSGVLRGFTEYSRVSKQSSLVGLNEIDYAIQCGINTTTIPSYETKRFLHFDKPGVQQYLEKLNRKFQRALRSISQPPSFANLNTLIQQIQSTTNSSDEILGMNHLESIPEKQTITTDSVKAHQRVLFDQNLFTCPITLDIMDNPAMTTPCGHMFEMDAIRSYTDTVAKICPICRTMITAITPNYAFKNVIEAWTMQQNI